MVGGCTSVGCVDAVGAFVVAVGVGNLGSRWCPLSLVGGADPALVGRLGVLGSRTSGSHLGGRTRGTGTGAGTGSTTGTGAGTGSTTGTASGCRMPAPGSSGGRGG